MQEGNKMDYTINELSKISGISTRALRYYDQIGLLVPERIISNGYRIYSVKEVDILQQILFYRELGVSLDEIKKLINAPDYDKEKSLQIHLVSLLNKQKQIAVLINNVRKTIASLKGATVMSDKEKFEGFTIAAVIGQANKSGTEITVELGRIKVQEMIELRHGLLIKFDKKETDLAIADIMVNGRLAAKGKIGITEEKFVVKVAEVIDDFFDLDEVIRLDRRSGEPFDLFVNGESILKCQTVIIDEYFGVRLEEA
jgi:DNA-binding transcriptional MerR regulator